MHNNSGNNLPPVIYVAESPELAINYKWDSRAAGINREVVVLDSAKIRERYQDVQLPVDIVPGEMLIRDPYCGGYIQAVNAEEEYIQAMNDGVFLIAQLLGATKITYKGGKVNVFKREIGNDNRVEYKAIEVGIGVKVSKDDKLCNKMQMTREFSPQEYTLAQFEKAMDIAEKRGLLNSRDIRSLLDARNPNFGNLMSRQTVEVEMSSSLNKVMDIAFTVKSAPFLDVSSSTHIAIERRIEIRREWDIIF